MPACLPAKWVCVCVPALTPCQGCSTSLVLCPSIEICLFLTSVGPCVPALIWIVAPTGQCCSSPLVLRCTAMVFLKPAVWPILWSKSIYCLVLWLTVAPLVQLLHQDIFTQNWCIFLKATLQKCMTGISAWPTHLNCLQQNPIPAQPTSTDVLASSMISAYC